MNHGGFCYQSIAAQFRYLSFHIFLDLVRESDKRRTLSEFLAAERLQKRESIMLGHDEIKDNRVRHKAIAKGLQSIHHRQSRLHRKAQRSKFHAVHIKQKFVVVHKEYVPFRICLRWRRLRIIFLLSLFVCHITCRCFPALFSAHQFYILLTDKIVLAETSSESLRDMHELVDNYFILLFLRHAFEEFEK